MDLQTAIYKTVHEYPGGGLALARDLHKAKPRTFTNKADPGQPHQFTLGESLDIQKRAGDYRILHAYAAELQHVALPVMAMEGVSDLELVEALLTHSMMFGQVREAILVALADNVIDQHELQDILYKMFKSMGAQAEVFRRLAGLCSDLAEPAEALEQWGAVAHA